MMANARQNVVGVKRRRCAPGVHRERPPAFVSRGAEVKQQRSWNDGLSRNCHTRLRRHGLVIPVDQLSAVSTSRN